MKITDRLFKETLLRVGPDDMKGVMRLVESGHTGIAERHCVSKLMEYVKGLEKKLGMDIPDPDHAPLKDNAIKIKIGEAVYYEDRVVLGQ